MPLKNLLRKSCRLQGFGRVKTRVKGSNWEAKNRPEVELVVDTVPFRENEARFKKKKKKKKK